VEAGKLVMEDRKSVDCQSSLSKINVHQTQNKSCSRKDLVIVLDKKILQQGSVFLLSYSCS